MNLLRAIILGILQGLTEFLPVSSSAHLVIIPWLAGWPEPGVTFDAVLHLGTALAIVAVFWRDILGLVFGWVNEVFRRRSSVEGRLAWLLILSAVPAALLGFLLNDFFDALFGTPRIVALLLLVTSLLLWLSEKRSSRTRPLTSLAWLDALTMGIAQGLAIAPGLSRSGTTLAAGLLRGLKREDAARFSFLMAVPVIVGAAGYKLLKTSLAANEAGIYLAGLLAAAVTGYLVIRAFLGYVRNHSLKPFALYCAVFGSVVFIITFFRP